MLPTDFYFPLLNNHLPPSWNIDERMRFFCAPFRNRSSNPEEWIHKYQFWHELINSWSSYYALCCFTLSVVNANFQRNSQKISCLPTVWQELYRNGEIISISDFLKEPSNTWIGWMVDIFIKKSTFWIFSKVKGYILEPNFNMTEKYVYLATVKELAELILLTVNSKNDNKLLSLSKLTKNCIKQSSNDRITEENIKLALIWLRRTKQAAFRVCKGDNSYNLLVKISSNNVEDVTEIDEGIYTLTQQEYIITKCIEELEKKRNEVILKAKLSLKNGLRQVAKSLLRKKHELDKCIEKRSITLHNVQKLLSSIDDAHYNTNTLAAYKAGCNILKKFESNGLTEDKAKDTVNDLSEIFEDLNEIKSIMIQPVLTVESDFELEKELTEIMKSTGSNLSTSAMNTNQLLNILELPDLVDLDLDGPRINVIS
ncbi:PREDICTED: charged multivesicular body protein 7 [Ceratosolen solmsi marchali]|uniref:Charged multivesicular body protein 7 n=1 Tax=Ceratosolen solmsi marchali TaxID=326594 RepID=A0AAJ6YFU3_9HYME|nr:PREDICTED: charged multivesicular body protein 7 [Ceratosolen solmsi marchali]